MAKNIRNLVLFKLGWIACVYFAATGQPFMATLAVAAVVATHLYSAPVMIKEAVLLAVAALGFVDDWQKERGDGDEHGGMGWRVKAAVMALAAALFRPEAIAGDTVICVATGGNVDAATYIRALAGD